MFQRVQGVTRSRSSSCRTEVWLAAALLLSSACSPTVARQTTPRGDNPIVVKGSPLFVTVHNRAGLPVVDVDVAIVPVGNKLVIGDAPVKVGVEAAIRQGWDAIIGSDGVFVGMTGFGASAPYKDLYNHFGITAAKVAEAREGFAKALRADLNTAGALGAMFGIGLLNGLLPCGLVYVALAGAVSQQGQRRSAPVRRQERGARGLLHLAAVGGRQSARR